MKLKKLLTVIGLTIISLIIVVCIGFTLGELSKSFEGKTKESLSKPYCINLVNKTGVAAYDTIVLLAAQELDINHANITLYSLDQKTMSLTFGSNTALAVTRKNEWCINTYSITSIPVDIETAIRTLTHEMVHVQQLHTNKLGTMGNSIRFGDMVYDPATIRYENRPWEIEADKVGDSIANIIHEKWLAKRK